MRQILYLLRYYAALVALFAAAKPCFMLAQGTAVRGALTAGDVVAVIWHGLPLDLATAGYLTALPWLLSGISIWTRVPATRIIYKVYAISVAAVLSVVYVADACLYGFWGIKLDGTALGYLDQPGGALASVSAGYALCAVLAVLFIGIGVYYILKKTLPHETAIPSRRILWTAAWAVAGGLLFLGIRGGTGRSTANVGMVYFSDRQFLNHSAVNPAFSVVSSLFKTKDFTSECDFFSEEERARLFSTLHYSTRSIPTDTLLTTPRPNVLIILMEGCGGTFCHAADSLSDARITPHLNQLAQEGVLFSQCYANSFRTDRGTVSALSGWPAYPDLSVMKIPSLVQRLPSIAASLRRAGYSTSFLYGGDINFTQTKGYLIATGYERAEGDTSFPPETRRTHAWGVTDKIAFDTLFARLMRLPQDRPWHAGFLTLASHEPWKVPYSRIPGDERANAMAYLDDCIGRFTARLRRSRLWKNTLVIFLPDHGIGYPDGIAEDDPRRCHIPLIWTGGAVRRARRIPTLCNQSDLAATLLGQMGLPHEDFPFSRDVLSQTYTRPSAAHVWSGGILWQDNTGRSALNLITRPATVQSESPRPSARRVQAAKAYLQTVYDALGKKSNP